MNIKFNTKPYMVLLIISIVLFISVFLPWYSMSILGTHIGSINGFRNGGILTFLMSLVGVGLSFIIVLPRYRALAIAGAGILSLLGVIIAMTDLGGGLGMGVGMIIALILSMGLIAIGFLDLRKTAPAAAAKQESPPPAPPAPPEQPSGG